MSRGDLRATLANLWDLMNGFNADLYNRRFVEDVRPVENSASSVDSVPINIPLSLSLSPLCRRYMLCCHTTSSNTFHYSY